MDLRKLKEKAAESFAKGKFARAAELYEAYCAGDARDIQARLRMGDAFAKAGAKEKAIGAYKFAAEGYARDGFLPRAIAASKLILELDPTHQGVQRMLADLYAKRDASGARKRSPATEAPAAPMVPPAASSRWAAIDLPDDGGDVEMEIVPAQPSPGVSPPRSEASAAPSPPPEPVPPRLAEEELPATAEIEEVLELPEVRDVVEVQEVLADSVPRTPVPPQPTARRGASPASGGSAPPGLRPKRITSEIPVQPTPPPSTEPVVELTVRKTVAPLAPQATLRPPAPSRIWLPETFTPLPGAIAVPPSAAPAAQDDGRRRTEGEPRAGLHGSSRFDELDLDMAPAEPFHERQATAVAPPAAPASPGPGPRGKPPGMPSFAQLELEGDSLLHAVELAARAGQDPGPTAPEDERTDEPMASEAEDFQGESTTPAGLPKIPLFSDLSADAFIELFDRCPLRRFGQGERIIEQGSVGDSFFVICAGAVRVMRQDEEGPPRELAVLQEGAFFGEVALLSGAPRTASVVSHAEETQLLEISATVLTQLSHRYPQVAAALKKFCRQRLLANVMSSSPLFRLFDRKDRKELVQRFLARDVRKDDLIIREGTPSDGLYVVLSGEVEVNKGKVHLAKLREGDIFGEISLLQKQPATASVTAARRTSLLRLPREAFDQIILTHPQVLQLVSELSDVRQKRIEAVLSGELLV